MPVKDREKNAAYQREWAAKNREKARASKRRWREKNRGVFNATRKAYRSANREKLQAAKRKWEQENPDRVAATKAIAKIRKERKALERELAWRYDFTLADYEALLVAQAHRCAICGTAKGNGRGHRLYVDHDHSTGDIRGLLCSKCNSAIGYFGDSPKRLRRAAAYLETWRGKTCPDERRGFQPILGCVSEEGSPFRRPKSVDATSSISGTSGGDLGRDRVAAPTDVMDKG
jgi:hypothetical protein